MRYITVLLAISLFAAAACGNKAEGDKGEPPQATTGTDNAAGPQGQSAGETPPPSDGQQYAFAGIEGKQWVLSKYTYEGNPERPVGEDPIYIVIEGNNLSGNGGCNNLTGQAGFKEGGAVDISGIAKTKKLCGGLMIQETRIIQLLESAETYKVNLVFLELSGPEGSLTFRNDLK